MPPIGMTALGRGAVLAAAGGSRFSIRGVRHAKSWSAVRARLVSAVHIRPERLLTQQPPWQKMAAS
ncbi:MAG TPA: hypothetical protein VNF73_06810, partial [Candidatus Saccharimonadales bacterium]|nr:hypothetical protein [Candidatus Saccharimonadales bacterium]